ncbi:MAG: helix-turn-helix domain-containing protein [archaeon]
MLIKQDLVRKIKDYFNLNVYETKVWLALLKKGVASAGEVASISGVPRSRTYDVLEGLEKRGFAIAKLEKPTKYIGVKPKMIIDKLKNNIRTDADERVVELSKIKESEEFSQLESLYGMGVNSVKREDVSAALKGKQNITNQIKEIIQNAKEEVVICTSVTEFIQKAKLFEKTLKILKNSNIKVKIALSGNENMIKQVSEKLGIKIKRVNLDAKFFVIDRKEILFYLSRNSDEDDFAIWLNSEFFSSAFVSLFEKALGK